LAILAFPPRLGRFQRQMCVERFAKMLGLDRVAGGLIKELLLCQLTAFFTGAPILASSAAVNSVRAKEVGHMAPSSRFAVSLKPNVVYLLLTSAHFGRSRRPCRPRHTRASRTRISARGWRAGFDDGMEPLNDGAIRFRQLGDLREPRFAYRSPSLRWWLTVCAAGPPDQRGSPARSRPHRPLYQAHAPTPAQNWRRRCPS
jgi:hypothetical protein